MSKRESEEVEKKGVKKMKEEEEKDYDKYWYCDDSDAAYWFLDCVVANIEDKVQKGEMSKDEGVKEYALMSHHVFENKIPTEDQERYNNYPNKRRPKITFLT